MGERVVARRCTRGGEDVQARRPSRARVTLALAAVVDCAALAAYPPLRAGRLETALLVPGLGAVPLVLGAVVLGWEPVVPWAVVLLAGSYTGALFAGHLGIDLAAPAYGVLLLLLPELVAWSLQERRRIQVEAPAYVLRAAAVALVALAGAALGLLALSTSAISVRGGLAWETVGVMAAVAAVGVVVGLRGSPR